MALIAAHLNAEVILVVTVYRRVYNLPLPPPPYPLSPFSPSLISLMVSVDVKHHVYLLYTRAHARTALVELLAVEDADTSSFSLALVWLSRRCPGLWQFSSVLMT